MVDLRKAKKFETPDIYELVQQTIKAVYPKYYPLEVTKFFCRFHTQERIFRDISEGNVWVLSDDTMLLGTCTCVENMIMRLFVRPEFQNLGYGRIILDDIEKNILQKYDRVILEAVISASRLYERRGYKTVSHEKLFICESAMLCYEVMKLERV